MAAATIAENLENGSVSTGVGVTAMVLGWFGFALLIIVTIGLLVMSVLLLTLLLPAQVLTLLQDSINAFGRETHRSRIILNANFLNGGRWSSFSRARIIGIYALNCEPEKMVWRVRVLGSNIKRKKSGKSKIGECSGKRRTIFMNIVF